MGQVAFALVMPGVVLALAGCTAFPDSQRSGAVSVSRVKEAVECELAAAARSYQGQRRHLDQWIVATDLDITLERNFAADGTVTVGIPTGLGSTSPVGKIGGADTDTRQSSLKFATSIPQAMLNQPSCLGDNPSETNMGLANWIQGSLEVLEKDELITISYVKTFKLEVNGGARFGYVLTPVVNTVDASAGFSTYRNYTNRMSIALTPPPPKVGLPRVVVANIPLLVREVNPPSLSAPPPPPPPPPQTQPPAGNMMLPQGGAGQSPTNIAGDAARSSTKTTEQSRSQSKRPKRAVTVPRSAIGSPRERAINDPILLQQLLRNSPTYRQ